MKFKNFESLEELNTGDIVRQKLSKNCYQVIKKSKDRVIGVSGIAEIETPEFWEVFKKGCSHENVKEEMKYCPDCGGFLLLIKTCKHENALNSARSCPDCGQLLT